MRFRFTKRSAAFRCRGNRPNMITRLFLLLILGSARAAEPRMRRRKRRVIMLGLLPRQRNAADLFVKRNRIAVGHPRNKIEHLEQAGVWIGVGSAIRPERFK